MDIACLEESASVGGEFGEPGHLLHCMGEEMATRRSEATPRVIGREALGPGLLQPSSVAFLPMPLVCLSSHEGPGESQRKAPLFVPKASGRRRSPRGGQLLPFLCASDFSAWRAQPPGGLRGVLLGGGHLPGIAAAPGPADLGAGGVQGLSHQREGGGCRRAGPGRGEELGIDSACEAVGRGSAGEGYAVRTSFKTATSSYKIVASKCYPWDPDWDGNGVGLFLCILFITLCYRVPYCDHVLLLSYV